MERPQDLLKDGFSLIARAEAIVNQAVSDCRALNAEERSLVEVLKAQGEPLIQRGRAMLEALQAER